MSRPTGELFAWLRARRVHQTEALERLVGIDSQWSSPDGVRVLAGTVTRALDPLGFTAAREPHPAIDPERRWVAELLAPGADLGALAETHVYRRDGSGDPVLVLADADTAFRGGADAESAFRVDGDRAYGTGVADMKAGIVVLLEALEALADGGHETPPLIVVLAGDEQAGSPGSREVIRREAARCAVALCVECARDGGQYMASRAHIGVGLIEAIGRESHAGTARDEGVSAIASLARALPAVDALSRSPSPLVTVTIVEGGRRRSVVPGTAHAIVDLRAADAAAWDEMVAQLEAVVEREAGAAELRVRTAVHRPGVPWTARTDDLLGVLRELGDEVGVGVRATGSMAAGSSAFAAEAGATVLDGMGAPGSDLMTDQEHVSVSGIAERAALLAGLLRRLAGSPARWDARTTVRTEPRRWDQ